MSVNRSLDQPATDEARAEALSYYGISDLRYEAIQDQVRQRHDDGQTPAVIASRLRCRVDTVTEILRRTA